MPGERLDVACCIAGGGPAAMMLGFLLARAGVEVVVLEKHADFLRDFRGDTIHPSTLQVIHELGVLDAFLKRPHHRVHHLQAQIGDTSVTIADFSRLPTVCKFIALMPQWDFLDFLAQHGRGYSTFRLRMEHEVTELIHEGGRVTGVRARTPQGVMEVRAGLVVGADGRGSIVRKLAGLEVLDLGAPMDVLWMRLSKGPQDPAQTLGRVEAGRFMVLIDRGDYWQCAFVIPKGGFEVVRQRGLPTFREELVRLAPFLRDRVHELAAWSDIKLLSVRVDRLRQWHQAGLLCIGDAAHAMSPVGGVGINLAIQDAVATANIMAGALATGRGVDQQLPQVQQRREWPTRMTQRLQVLVQNRVIGGVLASQTGTPMRLPAVLRLFQWWTWPRWIPALVVGLGFRPEHVRTAERAK